MQTEQAYLFVGKTNQLQIYSLDEDIPIKGSLSFAGNVNYLQLENDIISIATDQNEALILDIQQNSVLGRIKCKRFYILDIQHNRY